MFHLKNKNRNTQHGQISHPISTCKVTCSMEDDFWRQDGWFYAEAEMGKIVDLVKLWHKTTFL